MTETRPKYGNRRTVVDGQAFASAAEARRFQELRLLERAGAISDLRCQPEFFLQEKFTDRDGRKWPAIRYYGDFSYYEPGNDRLVVEDVKGMRTVAFGIKEKLLRYRYPGLDFRLVNTGKTR